MYVRKICVTQIRWYYSAFNVTLRKPLDDRPRLNLIIPIIHVCESLSQTGFDIAHIKADS